MRRSQGEAESDLGHLFGIFYDGMMAGVGAYYGPETRYAETAHLHRKTTKRSIVFDHATYALSLRLDGIDGLTTKRGGETVRFLVYGKWIISIHKADKDLRIGLNKTRQSWLFQSNELPIQPALDETLDEDEKLFPEMTSLFLVYVPHGDLDTPEIYLLCPKRGGVNWARQLHQGGAATVVEFPITDWPGGDDEELVKVPDSKEETDESE